MKLLFVKTTFSPIIPFCLFMDDLLMTHKSGNFTFSPCVSNNLEFSHAWENFVQSSLAISWSKPVTIAQYVNGKSLACPMPLLKLKMALKNTAIGDSVYLTATDANSCHDIGAFCRHLGYDFSSIAVENAMLEPTATVFHILVQKSLWWLPTIGDKSLQNRCYYVI